jgi:hypothetical protein
LNFLREEGKTVSDQRLIIELILLGGKVKRALIAHHGVKTGERVYREIPWVRRRKTNCAAGYVVPNCRQYRGPMQPEITI